MGDTSALRGPHHSLTSLPPGQPPQVKAGPAEHRNSYLGYPGAAFNNLPLSDFWPVHLRKLKRAGLEEGTWLDAQLPISITRSWQGCQNLLCQTSAQSLKVMVPKLLTATCLLGARTSAAGNVGQQLEVGVLASVTWA